MAQERAGQTQGEQIERPASYYEVDRGLWYKLQHESISWITGIGGVMSAAAGGLAGFVVAGVLQVPFDSRGGKFRFILALFDDPRRIVVVAAFLVVTLAGLWITFRVNRACKSH